MFENKEEELNEDIFFQNVRNIYYIYIWDYKVGMIRLQKYEHILS